LTVNSGLDSSELEVTAKALFTIADAERKYTRGCTVADISSYHNEPTDVDVGVKIDDEGFMKILL
jgi:hypothetical protein